VSVASELVIGTKVPEANCRIRLTSHVIGKAKATLLASGAFKAVNVEVKAGDYIIRADQPYRTIPEMYF